MKKILLLVSMFFCGMSMNAQEEPVMTKQKGVYTINTTTLCNYKGYNTTTPLLVTVKGDVIQQVTSMSNGETPRFFSRIIMEMLPKYRSLKFEDYGKVDCISGATKSSRAVQEHMKAAYEYYTANKKKVK